MEPLDPNFVRLTGEKVLQSVALALKMWEKWLKLEFSLITRYSKMSHPKILVLYFDAYIQASKARSNLIAFFEK